MLYLSRDVSVMEQLHNLFSIGAVAFNNAHFGAGIGSVFLNSVNCSGTETGLLGCYYRTSSSGCSHSEDAGVRCQGI